jgi:cytochrome c553
MTLRNFLTLSLAATALALSVPAAAAGVKGNATAGKQKAGTCASCHGVEATGKLENGTAAPENVPMIAGQYPDYLAKALKDYRSGKRTDPQMTGMAKGLTDEDINDLSAYYGSLDSGISDLSDDVQR